MSHRREEMSAAAFARDLQAARDGVLHRGLYDVPPTRHAQNLALRCREHGEAHFTFVTAPEVGPTNNLAEQAIRFVVIDRHLTQGDAQRGWPALVRTHLDGDRDRRATRPLGVCVLERSDRPMVSRRRGAVARAGDPGGSGLKSQRRHGQDGVEHACTSARTRRIDARSPDREVATANRPTRRMKGEAID